MPDFKIFSDSCCDLTRSMGRISTTLSCTFRVPRNSLTCGVNATSTWSPWLTPARSAVVEKKMALSAAPPRLSRRRR